ncbi:hypothetical protein [uncultured Brachyspira sp.]|uniref:hypothetical protein n=1 Tax=uncultured Brachyspira sp. TaxID=221953 RepID=UPI002616F020|nr:hypothetical protein [uncultured Brachyspira sp.]
MMKSYDAIFFYIKRLKENNIKDFKIIDKKDYYVIYIFIKRDSKIRKIINEISYEVHSKFNIYKTIQCQYFYDWFINISSFENDIIKNSYIDLTSQFLNNFYSKKKIL